MIQMRFFSNYKGRFGPVTMLLLMGSALENEMAGRPTGSCETARQGDGKQGSSDSICHQVTRVNVTMLITVSPRHLDGVTVSP